MATSRAAYAAEQAIGHEKENLKQDVSNYQQVGDQHETMKALIWQGKQKVEVVDVAKPRILEDGDVILKVTGTTVCGSDLHLLHGTIIQLNKGDILGHEFCGVVDQCFFCKQKLSSQCEKTNSNRTAKAMYGSQTAGFYGYSHFTGGFAGGQAEYVRVPLGDVNLLEIPDDVPDEKALYLSDVLPTAYNAVKDTAVYPNDQVAIFGAGPIGQMAGVFAIDEGASKVIFVDTEPRVSAISNRWPAQHKDKLELIDYKKLSFGVTNKETVVSKLKDMCGGRGPDVAIECAAGEYAKGWMHWLEMSLGAETDTSEILNEMVESVRNYGRAGITGVYVGYTNHFNVGSLMQRGIRLIGNGQAPVMKYWDGLLQKIRLGQLDPTQMLSHRFRLEDIDKVYHMFDAKEDNIQKVFVETKFSFPRAEGTPELTKL
ncbi:123e3c59-6431-4e6a-a5ba-96c9785b6de5 [Thermothielavioides terrestris]|uniref:123e3c59-6431-4e6a-a5ba-96c9785b6de5 n=1 Tax=Thermothielavioides terrestris TaxID=2587410 RepID=A0A446BE34_9PEZI|nr:123e3c59-6431-4e6a-a5ba-96c9785b6de5 [Thermothielavioides terrestris]